MEGKGITIEQLMAELQGNFRGMAEKMVEAMNSAQGGRIIADTEEPVRNAHAEFRQQAYQKSIDLLAESLSREALSSRAIEQETETPWRNKGKRSVSHITVNGVVSIRRTVYWSKDHGSVSPADGWLGIAGEGYSPGVREMACRVSLNEGFVPAHKNLKRTAQLSIRKSALRELVLREGRRSATQMGQGLYGPDWTWKDCTDQTVATGADGVMVPMVTEQQKRKRRKTESAKRDKEGRRSTARSCRPRAGADGDYKEFKLVTFYDAGKKHKYAVGTGGDHKALGRMMRREARKIRLDEALRKYSVTDGAEWIARQYAAQLPMLDVNILDYYPLRDHVIAASHVLYGEGTAKAEAWRETMMEHVWNQGSLSMLDRLGNYLRHYRSGAKREALSSLRSYVHKRVDMTDYPTYRRKGYDCGSGPTESFCGTLTARLKGRGMRWDRDNAEAIMALGSLYYSNLWDNYWPLQRTG